eukprot:scaffold1210_cov214-Skeletonema_marinoi.AAC.13
MHTYLINLIVEIDLSRSSVSVDIVRHSSNKEIGGIGRSMEVGHEGKGKKELHLDEYCSRG